MEVERLYQEVRESFIKSRTYLESEVKKLSANIAKAPEEFLLQHGIEKKDYTLQELVPELYKETVDRRKLQMQIKSANDIIDKWNKLVDENNKEAEECLLKYREILQNL